MHFESTTNPTLFLTYKNFSRQNFPANGTNHAIGPNHAETKSKLLPRPRRKWKISSAVQAKTDASKSRGWTFFITKAAKRVVPLHFSFFSLRSLWLLARHRGEMSEGYVVERRNERRKFALKDDGQPGGSAQYLGARGACKRRGMGITRSFVTGLFAYVARVFRGGRRVRFNWMNHRWISYEK